MTLQRTLEWSVDAAAIDRARILCGWTRRDLAHLFAGRRRPTFGTLRAICQSLGLSLESVIEFSESRHSDQSWPSQRE